MAIQRVSRNSDGALGWAEQKTAPVTIRDLLVDALPQVGCDVGDYLIVFDDTTQDAVPATMFDNMYTVIVEP